MDSEPQRDLGHGVFVTGEGREELMVTSPRLDLGWSAASATLPGTAVLWEGEVYEVVTRVEAPRGGRWILRRWPESVSMRGVSRLDAATISERAAEQASRRRRQRMRWWSVPLLPLMGLAPGSVQQRLSEDWGVDSGVATWSSAALEVLLGGFAVLQGVVMLFGGGWFLPDWLRWAVVVGPLLFIEGLVRMVLAAASDEAVGAVAGLPLLLLQRAPARPAAPPPVVRTVEDDPNMIEIASPAYRSDWHRDGVLPYRDDWYRLIATDRQGAMWLYRFERTEVPAADDLRMRLKAPGPAPDRQGRERPPSILATALITAAVTLGPARDQVRWGAHMNLRPVWFTLVGAGAELVGGFTNLGRDLEAGLHLMAVFDAYLIAEGLVRLGSVILGQPMASALGWVIRPLYRRFLPR